MLNRAAIVTALVLAASLTAHAQAEQENPYLQPDDTWISISGTVEDVEPHTFTLDYGEGIVSVEMDDGDRDADAYKLLEGDKVTVNGMIDDDFYETTTIEASSVYVEKLGTYFFASDADEEDPVITVTSPVTISETIVQGTVSEVVGDEFIVNTGERELTVEVDELPYDPLDDEGYLRIEKGDVVSITGMIDDDLFEGRVFEARTLVELED